MFICNRKIKLKHKIEKKLLVLSLDGTKGVLLRHKIYTL